MNRTPIEWVKNPDGTQGYTWNPITGCLNGCEYCYARKLANTRLFSTYCSNTNLAPNAKGSFDSGAGWVGNLTGDYTNAFYPRFWPERLSCQFSYSSKKAQGIFVCDMSDLFGIGIPEQWTEQVMQLIGAYPQHRFYLLTKQPQNLIKWSPFPDNCWVGVTTVGDFDSFSNALGYLWEITAETKYLSIEPFLYEPKVKNLWFQMGRSGISQVIIGAQTKPYKPPKIEWVQEIVQACDKAGVPVFLKDNLWPLFNGSKYAVPLWAFDKDSKLRQEMPSGK